MDRALNFWLLGGDLRQEKLARLLAEDGHTVHAFAMERADLPDAVEREGDLTDLRRADCVVLPLPAEGERGTLNAPMSPVVHPLGELLEAVSPRQRLFGGMVGEELTAWAAERGLTIYDYFAREELAVANAVPTAEGAVQIALEELGITLHRARVLVLGYGRVGRLTACRMAALGARVTVAARKYADLAWAEAYGHSAQRLADLKGYLCGYDLVVNTIPHPVLTGELLEDLKEGCLVIDLASKPGGAVVKPRAKKRPVRASFRVIRGWAGAGGIDTAP